MSGEKVYYLSKITELSELNVQELAELALDFQWEEYSQGDEIISQGQEQNRYYVLVTGKTEVLDSKQGDHPSRINTFGPGEAFGARSLLTDGPAPFTVRCLENCRVLVASEESFTRMLGRWPKLYKNLIKRMSNNLDQVNNGLGEARQKEFLRSILQHTQYANKFYGLWGSPKTTKLIEDKLAESKESREHLLVIGERGTGRQMMAWYLHKGRFGQAAPFIAVDGRELEKQWGDGIFETGQEAARLRSGNLLEFVAGGTLYIKEINKLSPRAQLNLAKALQAQKNNCLVVGSMQNSPEVLPQDLIPELRELFSHQFNIKPLRERKRDIPFIAEGILEKLANQHSRQVPRLDTEVTKLLLSHNYRQGNIVELIQVIERAFFLAEHDVISLEHVFFGPTAKKLGGTFDLLSFPLVEKLIKKGSLVLWLKRVTSFFFISIMILLFAVPEATINIGLFALVWGLWWPALAIISPLLGRVWCTVCPFAYLLEIVQKRIHWNHPVPDFIKKYNYLWITIFFLLILWLEIVFNLRSNPIFTGILLVTIMGAAVITGVIFTRHAWCHHLCPLGGFIGMASIGATLEVRADSTVCFNKCTTYDCYKGKGDVAGCPMSQYAPFVDNNLDCKLCFKCVQNCSNGAVKFNLRVPGREVWHLVRVNQGFVIFIGVALAILVPLNYFESLRQLGPGEKWFFLFSSLYYWGTAIAAGLLTWLIAQPFRTKAASRRVKLVFAVVPLVLAGYIIYQLHFIPGAASILLGLGYKTPTGNIQGIDIPIFKVGQFFAGLIGLLLTGFTFLMVILQKRKIKPDNINQKID